MRPAQQKKKKKNMASGSGNGNGCRTVSRVFDKLGNQQSGIRNQESESRSRNQEPGIPDSELGANRRDCPAIRVATMGQKEPGYAKA